MGLPSWMQEDWRIHVARDRDGSKPRRHNVVEHGPDFPAPRVALAGVEDLRRMVAAHPGMRGLQTARLALPDIRVGSDSPQETRMRLILCRAGLGEPVLNVVIRNGCGRPEVWPDAAYPGHRVALQ